MLAAISSPAFSAAYDGDGLRASKTAGGVTTYFLYDGTTPVIEESYNGTAATVTALSGYGADGLRSRYYPGNPTASQGTVYAFSYDPQGNVTQRHTPSTYASILGPSPALDTQFYDAFGALRQDYGIITSGHSAPSHKDPVGFGGQFGYYTDTETGLLCLTHRYYDPGTGKFLNRDPIGYAGGQNLYGFADGNPVNEMDPNGDDGADDLEEEQKRKCLKRKAKRPLVYGEVTAG